MAENEPMPSVQELQRALHTFDRPLEQFPMSLLISARGPLSYLTGTWERCDGERNLGAPHYRSKQQPRQVLCRVQLYVGNVPAARWRFFHPDNGYILDVGMPPAALPQCVKRWVSDGEREKQPIEIKAVWGAMLRLGGTELGEDSSAMPLSDAGVSAECAVEILRLPLQTSEPAGEGPLTVFVRAPSLGHPDAVALEVIPEATVGGLVAAFVCRFLQPAEERRSPK
eukprot:TRINITY_DN61334_c0_g1_i1.p1 TRINITY_DN61334_c0_g1~~TRINITY_DN61334_c0_g1_i1.p1  ORF type:complete len:226 (+),score=36.95 TRINITY_DN61334_c0_g1_i1:64-741(+)